MSDNKLSFLYLVVLIVCTSNRSEQQWENAPFSFLYTRVEQTTTRDPERVQEYFIPTPAYMRTLLILWSKFRVHKILKAFSDKNK